MTNEFNLFVFYLRTEVKLRQYYWTGWPNAFNTLNSIMLNGVAWKYWICLLEASYSVYSGWAERVISTGEFWVLAAEEKPALGTVGNLVAKTRPFINNSRSQQYLQIALRLLQQKQEVWLPVPRKFPAFLSLLVVLFLPVVPFLREILFRPK